MSDGETAYNLRERPIAWSDFPHDGNGSVTLYYGGLADALGPRPMSRCTSWGPMRPPSGRRRVGRGALRDRPFSTGPGLKPLDDLLYSPGDSLVEPLDQIRPVVRPSNIKPKAQ